MKKKVSTKLKQAPSLSQEMRRSSVAKPSPAVLRRQGQSLGSCYARLNGAERQQAANIVSAIQKGIYDDRARDEMTNELSNSDEFLSSLGF